MPKVERKKYAYTKKGKAAAKKAKAKLKKKSSGLTAAQKKLPKKLQQAIMKKNKKK